MNFQSKLSNGDFVLLTEISSPKGVDIFDLTENIRHIKSRVDAVVVPDMDNGVMHLNALATGSMIQQQGMEPIIHVSGRDRNRMALQGDMLAAHVLGIHNLLVVQAEKMANGDHPDAKPVDDLSEEELLAMFKSLMNGVDMAGFELKGSPRFFSGYQVQAICDDVLLEEEFLSAKAKVEAGANFIVVPPVFDIVRYLPILKKFQSLKVPVIATVFMLKSVGMARYISINDPGARMPESVISRIRKASDREAECILIASEMICALKNQVDGIKVSTSGWEKCLPAILDRADL